MQQTTRSQTARLQTTGFRATLLVGLAAFAGLAPLAHAATLAEYDFEANRNSTDTNPFSVAGPIDYSADEILVDLAPGSGNPGTALKYATRESTIGAAKLHDGIVTMTLAPVPGFAMNLYFFETDLAAQSLESTNFTAQLFVFSSLDNYADPIHFNLATDTTPSLNDADHGPYSHVESNGMLLNQAIYSNVTTPVEFRFYFLGTSVQYALLDNIRISGTMAVAPEPATLASAAALLLLGARRHRRSH